MSPKKASLSHVCIGREGIQPLKVNVTSFREAKLAVHEWVSSQPQSSELVHTSINLHWENGGYFNLGLMLAYPSGLDKINVLECTKYLIGFALGKITNPSWTVEENARRLQLEQLSGAAEHCRFVSETCLLEDSLLH